MAILKDIVLGNGIVVNYHRVVSVNNITNKENVIEIASYISKAKRLEEITKLAANEPMNIFIDSKYISITYDQTLDVDGAYTYLKTLDMFIGYTDDLDE